MRVERVTCDVLMAPQCDIYSCDTSQDNAVVRVWGADGQVGIGEVESNPWVIRSLINSPSSNAYSRGLGELLVGEDAADPRQVWDNLYRQSILVGRRGAGICAIGALDMAVWDLCGKASEAPVWKLLDGGRAQDSVVPYASLLPTGRNLAEYREDLLAKVEWAVTSGFRAAKLEILIRGPFAQYGMHESNDAIVEIVGTARAIVGPAFDLMVDVGYCWEDWREAAAVLERCERYEPYFIETPLQPDDLGAYARLAGVTEIPVAAGELLQTRFEFEELMDRGHVDIVQPDIGRVGGITEAFRVSRLAEERGKRVVPHCWRSAIGIAASAQIAAVSSNCPYIEYLPAGVAESALRRELVANEPALERGVMAIPDAPGLGVTLNARAFERFKAAAQRTESASDLARA